MDSPPNVVDSSPSGSVDREPVRDAADTMVGEQVVFPSLPFLPPEIWTMVFRHLGPFSLSRVRATCRTWNRIVCNCRALMDNFCIQLDGKSFVKNTENVRALVTTGDGGFTRVRFHEVSLVIPELMGVCWAPMAENLHTLSIVKCRLLFSFVVQLLEQTRNLRVLCFCDLEPRKELEDVSCSFRLDGLRNLRLALFGNALDAKILRIFREMCPRLEALEIKPKPWTQPSAEFSHEVVSFVKASRDTLVELTINPTKDLSEQLAAMNGLSLARLKLEEISIPMRELVCIIMAQKSHLEYLELNGSVGYDARLDIPKGGYTFPKLKNLQLYIQDIDLECIEMNFLHTMPKLEILQIQEIDFDSLEEELPNLKELIIINSLYRNSLEDIIQWCPNVRKVHLNDISILYLKEILEMVRLSENIEELTLTEIFQPEIENGLYDLHQETGDYSLTSEDLDLGMDTVSFQTHSSTTMRILDLQTDIPCQLLRTMVMVYPNLAELYLNHEPRCDSVFFVICRRLPQLKILGLCHCGKRVKSRVTESPRPSELLVITCQRDDGRVVRLLQLFAVNELSFVPCRCLKQDDYICLHRKNCSHNRCV
ncbi:hypothetical protein pipiens_014868 [Culex pipiens pipiens]|uniref:F-box domain-containing protein n=1 Tax=Culex pipiens pipiens TaxID=38569 RepID=A0ABD1CSU4_CULPP